MKLKEDYKKCSYGCSVEESIEVLKHNMLIKHFNKGDDIPVGYNMVKLAA